MHNFIMLIVSERILEVLLQTLKGNCDRPTGRTNEQTDRRVHREKKSVALTFGGTEAQYVTLSKQEKHIFNSD